MNQVKPDTGPLLPALSQRRNVCALAFLSAALPVVFQLMDPGLAYIGAMFAGLCLAAIILVTYTAGLIRTRFLLLLGTGFILVVALAVIRKLLPL